MWRSRTRGPQLWGCPVNSSAGVPEMLCLALPRHPHAHAARGRTRGADPPFPHRCLGRAGGWQQVLWSCLEKGTPSPAPGWGTESAESLPAVGRTGVSPQTGVRSGPSPRSGAHGAVPVPCPARRVPVLFHVPHPRVHPLSGSGASSVPSAGALGQPGESQRSAGVALMGYGEAGKGKEWEGGGEGGPLVGSGIPGGPRGGAGIQPGLRGTSRADGNRPRLRASPQPSSRQGGRGRSQGGCPGAACRGAARGLGTGLSSGLGPYKALPGSRQPVGLGRGPTSRNWSPSQPVQLGREERALAWGRIRPIKPRLWAVTAATGGAGWASVGAGRGAGVCRGMPRAGDAG